MNRVNSRVGVFAGEPQLVDLLFGEGFEFVQLREAATAALRASATLLREMPWVDAVARPEKPSARSWRIRFDWIFRTIENDSFHHTGLRGVGLVYAGWL